MGIEEVIEDCVVGCHEVLLGTTSVRWWRICRHFKRGQLINRHTIRTLDRHILFRAPVPSIHTQHFFSSFDSTCRPTRLQKLTRPAEQNATNEQQNVDDVNFGASHSFPPSGSWKHRVNCDSWPVSSNTIHPVFLLRISD